MSPRWSAVLACLAVTMPAAALADRAAEDSLIGLWSAHFDFGPKVRGELVVTRAGDVWRAAIAGREARFRSAGDSIRFDFGGGAGGFRGARHGSDIAGFWLQPSPAEDRRDSSGSAQRDATPLALRAAGKDRWRGTVRPLDDRFTLYMKVDRNESGVLFAAFRNPEQNSNGGASLMRVFRTGDSLWFGVRPDTASPYQRRVSGWMARDPERITVFWSDLGRAAELRRSSPAGAAAFFPRPPGDTSYVYRRPPETGDGWTTARAGEVGMSEDTLACLVRRLIRIDPATRRPSLIHSLLVAYRGRLVLEEYFFGFDRDTPHDLRSAGKTLGSVMLGAVIRAGTPIGPETPVYSALASRGPFANPDPRKARITVAHLLTHTSGLACDDNDDASPGNEDTMQSQSGQPDWWKYTLDLPMAHEPGERYAYCSANSNLVGAVLTTATHTWLPELFERTVARPLQFGRYHWNLMPDGEGYLGGGAHLRSRDLLKIGQLYLDGGVWKGHRVVDSTWVRISTAAHAHISPATTGLDSARFGDFYGEADDGYAWHLATLQSGDRRYRGYAATGNGGQVLMVVPELDLAVVFTAGNYGQGGIWTRFGSEIVPREIIPAIRR